MGERGDGYGPFSQALGGAEGRGGLQLCRALVRPRQFKELNDNLRYLVGDEPLVEVAAACRVWHVARVGGDKFALPVGVGHRARYRQGRPRRLEKHL